MKEILFKIIPDFFDYYHSGKGAYKPITEYDSEEEFIIATLEHELELYDNWKAEGFKNQQEVSYIKKENVKEVRKLIKDYYKK